MNAQAISQESLSRAVSGQSVMNYPSIFEGFAARGMPRTVTVFHISQTEPEPAAN